METGREIGIKKKRRRYRRKEEKNFREGSPVQEHCCGGQAGGCQLYFMAGQLCRLADQILHTENNCESVKFFFSHNNGCRSHGVETDTSNNNLLLLWLTLMRWRALEEWNSL